ncbi:MAG: ABC transporter permease [bacterium]
MGLLQAMQGAAAQGVLWSIMTLGVYITFKVLDFADLTVDGSFATGGAVTAILISHGMNPFLSLLFALAAGMACGFITGFLHTKLEIPGILAGILTMIALYSINIRIMGQANIPLLGISTIITTVSGLYPVLSVNMISLTIGLIFTAAVILFLYWFFGTEIGCSIRATGNNEYMVRALGVNTDKTKILGLVLSNGLVALSGAMVAQSQGYADVGMGTGTIMIGLASVIIGEVLMGNRFSFAYKLISAVVGSVIYRVIIALVLWLGLKSTDLKLFTSIIVAIALSIPVLNRIFQPVIRKMDKLLQPLKRKMDKIFSPLKNILKKGGRKSGNEGKTK